MRPLISGSRVGCSLRGIWGLVSSRVKIFSAEAMALCRVENCSASSWMGSKKEPMYCRNLNSVPMVMTPIRAVRPPKYMTMASATTLSIYRPGRKRANTIISRKPALYRSSFFFENSFSFCASQPKTWMIFMPERCSLR